MDGILNSLKFNSDAIEDPVKVSADINNGRDY